MLKQDVLTFLYEDWKASHKQLNQELAASAADRAQTLQRIAVADKWMAHYAGQLHELYGVKL